MEWIGEAAIQIGAFDAPPAPQVAPFLGGFVDGLTGHAAVRDARLLDVDGLGPDHHRNPTRHVRFRLLADSYADAERLAVNEVRGRAIRAGVEALDPSLRRFGWMVSVSVAPAVANLAPVLR